MGDNRKVHDGYDPERPHWFTTSSTELSIISEKSHTLDAPRRSLVRRMFAQKTGKKAWIIWGEIRRLKEPYKRHKNDRAVLIHVVTVKGTHLAKRYCPNQMGVL